MGYVLMTFSHSDEARLYLMENQTLYFGHMPIDVSLKSTLDHSQLD